MWVLIASVHDLCIRFTKRTGNKEPQQKQRCNNVHQKFIIQAKRKKNITFYHLKIVIYILITAQISVYCIGVFTLCQT